MNCDRYADLWLTDFSTDPEEITREILIRPFLVARKGEPTGKRGRPAQRNLVIFRFGFTLSTSWTDAIEELIRGLGGWDEVGRLSSRYSSMQRLIQLTLPIRNSPYQENDFIKAATLGRLADHGIDLGIEFCDHLGELASDLSWPSP